MNESNTVDSILAVLHKWSGEKHPIDAHTWLEASAKLIVLISDEQNKLFLIEQKLAEKKLLFMKEFGDSVAKAKVKIEALDEYVESRKLEAKIEQVTELVRISKLQARLSDNGQKNY